MENSPDEADRATLRLSAEEGRMQSPTLPCRKERSVSYETLAVTKDEHVTTIRFDRPDRLNAIDRVLTLELTDVMREMANDPETRVVVLTGGDKVFCVGADIREQASADTSRGPTLRRKTTVFDEIERLDRIVIAAIAGYALGGGLEFALACDLRIAASNAKFGLPEVKLGVIPSRGGTQRLPRLVGAARAKEFMLMGETIDAKRAEEIGLVNRVVEPAALMDEALSLARTLAELPPLAVRGIKSCVNTGMDTSLEVGLEHEARIVSMLHISEDRAEGMRAFVEKRKPVFKGR
jgi:enoyl-CoA hydratase